MAEWRGGEGRMEEDISCSGLYVMCNPPASVLVYFCLLKMHTGWFNESLLVGRLKLLRASQYQSNEYNNLRKGL